MAISVVGLLAVLACQGKDDGSKDHTPAANAVEPRPRATAQDLASPKKPPAEAVEREPSPPPQPGHDNRGAYTTTFSPDGTLVLSGGMDNGVLMWDVASGKEVARFAGHERGVFDVAFSADGTIAASASKDKTVRVWDLDEGSRVLRGHTGYVTAVAFTSDGKFVVSGSYHGKIRVWSLATGKSVRVIDNDASINDMALVPDGGTVVTGDSKGHLNVYKVATGHRVRSLSDHREPIKSVAVSADGKFAITGGGDVFDTSEDFAVRVWNLASGKVIRRLVGHTFRVMCVALSKDGKFAASTGQDNRAYVWDARTGKVLKKVRLMESGRGCSFSDDGGTLLLNGRHPTEWNLKDNRMRWLGGGWTDVRQDELYCNRTPDLVCAPVVKKVIKEVNKTLKKLGVRK